MGDLTLESLEVPKVHVLGVSTALMGVAKDIKIFLLLSSWRARGAEPEPGFQTDVDSAPRSPDSTHEQVMPLLWAQLPHLKTGAVMFSW